MTADATSPTYTGAAFDGRFIYYVPSSSVTSGPKAFSTLLRYDTQSTFTADCAWSSVDLTQVDAGGVSPVSLNGAIFDGQYLYLIPNANGLIARFLARTPGAPPSLPGENGSFW